jgi:hypothetical protein
MEQLVNYFIENKIKLPSFIKEDDLKYIFDISAFDRDITLKILYSVKLMSCRTCMRKKKINKHTNSKKYQVDDKICLECDNKGVRDGRKYQYIAYYDSLNDNFEYNVDLNKQFQTSFIKI